MLSNSRYPYSWKFTLLAEFADWKITLKFYNEKTFYWNCVTSVVGFSKVQTLSLLGSKLTSNVSVYTDYLFNS